MNRGIQSTQTTAKVIPHVKYDPFILLLSYMHHIIDELVQALIHVWEAVHVEV